ncbi:MAG: glycoside hydrolase family 76 protein [Verrucomicrobiota bacterium]|nr:glycoside hydrolase family 76 protein [Verrucomicrobiota bacterium]
MATLLLSTVLLQGQVTLPNPTLTLADGEGYTLTLPAAAGNRAIYTCDGASWTWVPAANPFFRNGKWIAYLPPMDGSSRFYRVSTNPVIIDSSLLTWGHEVADQIEKTLRVKNSNLYSEAVTKTGTRFGGDSSRAYIWPVSTQFRTLNSLTSINPDARSEALRAFADEVLLKYWSASGGYRSGLSANSDRFYDDNAHMVVALCEAWLITGDDAYLERAEATQQFVMSGEAPAGGGIYFATNQKSELDAGSTLQGARAAALLYKCTGKAAYLTDARRQLDWAATHIQQDNGAYYQWYWVTGAKANQADGSPLVNAISFALSARVLLYETTGDLAELTEARRLAEAAIAKYIDPDTKIRDEGYWAYELIEGLANLYEIDPQSRWIVPARDALLWLHAHKRDPNGNYASLWGRDGDQTVALSQWTLNDMAAVARAYLRVGLVRIADEPAP